MENLVVRRQSEGDSLDSKKLPLMRTLARFHECDEETLFRSVDASDLDVHEILVEMVSMEEVEASSEKAVPRRSFALTVKGWSEYLKAIGSIYEIPE